jgi:hypothetical protein
MAIEDRTNPMQGVSGPGPYAKRTDLSYQSQSYGDAAAYQAGKSAAPLATAPKSPLLSQAPTVRPGAAPAGVGLYEPTQRPNEPITAGVDVGAGAGSDSLMMAKPEDDTNFRATIQSYGPVLSYIASLPNTSPETRRAIRQLRDAQ